MYKMPGALVSGANKACVLAIASSLGGEWSLVGLLSHVAARDVGRWLDAAVISAGLVDCVAELDGVASRSVVVMEGCQVKP